MAELSESRTESFSKLAEPARKGARITAIGIATSATLALVKLVGGVLGNSYALTADGIESILDVFSASVVWGSLRIAAWPPTKRFPFGFGRTEPLAGLVVAIMLLAAAVGLAFHSVREIFTPHDVPKSFTLIVLAVVVVAKETLFRRALRTGDKIGSNAVKNDAWHHRTDAITSVAAFIGISIAVVNGKGYEGADDWAALVASMVIALNGVHILRSSLGEALDEAPPIEHERQARSIAERVAGVSSIEKCRVRKSGLGLFVELHVVVDGGVSVREGHRIGHRVKDALLAANQGIVDVALHVEPSDAAGAASD